jgi:uncharacterized membrane protein YGL010W
MATAFALGTLAWNWLFANSQPHEIKNAIIIINIVGWGFQFIGHGFFESITSSYYREKTSFIG